MYFLKSIFISVVLCLVYIPNYINAQRDTIKLIHSVGFGFKVINDQRYGQDNFGCNVQYNKPAIDVFYSLNFPIHFYYANFLNTIYHSTLIKRKSSFLHHLQSDNSLPFLFPVRPIFF